MTTKVFILNQRPIGAPTLKDFKLIIEEVPSLDSGYILLKTRYISVDPYLRGRMNAHKSYIAPFELQQPIQSSIVAEVIESNNPTFQIGNMVVGILPWKEYNISNATNITKINTTTISPSAYLGILGMPGLTAYIGLIEIGQPKAGETIVVSGAAGAVGTIVGQIGKILNCHVVGIAGSDEKVNLLTSMFKFDHAINYQKEKNITMALETYCPKGVDVYFDNVGGTVSDAVLPCMNKHARIPICGAISLYNETNLPIGPRVQPILLTKSATMRGFIISDFKDTFPTAIKQLLQWIDHGSLIYTETVIDGFEQAPQAFIELFEGKNKGKMIVKV